jgi:hypothetical protein
MFIFIRLIVWLIITVFVDISSFKNNIEYNFFNLKILTKYSSFLNLHNTTKILQKLHLGL